MDNPVTFSDITLLNTLATCANMTTDEVFKDFKIMANKKILENHKYEIYYSESEKSWRTYLPDETKPNKRRPVKRKSKENLEKEIIRFYIEKQKAENRQNVTLEELYAEWLLYKRDYTSVKAKTIQEYVSEWNRFFKDTELVKMKIGEIKPITLIRFFREATKDRQFTHKRVSNARSVLNGIMSYAIEEEIISHNPVSDVNFKQFTYKPVEVQSDNVFSRDDTHKLLNYLRCIIEPYSLAIQLSFYLFIRVGETKAIRWEDIDYNNRLVYLHRQATCERTLNDDLTFSSRKVKVVNQMKGNTSHGFRKQFLTDEALKILHKAKELNPNGIYVFEPNGEIMTTDSFNRRLKKYCKEAGVPYHSSHKIRFYNASTAFDGNNLTTLSYLMEPRTQVVGRAQIIVLQAAGRNQLVHLAEHAVLRVGDGFGEVEPSFPLHVHVHRHLILRVHDVEVFVGRDHAVGEFAGVIDGADAGAAALGGDDDHARHGACSVDRSGGTVFEDVEAFDVLGVETGDGRRDERRGVARREVVGVDVDDVLHDDAVNDPQGFRTAVDRRCAAHADLRRRAERAGYVLDGHAGRPAFQTAADVCHTGQFHIVGDQLIGGSREQPLVHFGHTRYHDGFDGLGIGFEFHLDRGCGDVCILGFVAHVGDLELPLLGNSRKNEFTFDIGRSADSRAILDDDGRTDDGCVVLIDDTTFDRLGLGPNRRHTENRRQR